MARPVPPFTTTRRRGAAAVVLAVAALTTLTLGVGSAVALPLEPPSPPQNLAASQTDTGQVTVTYEPSEEGTADSHDVTVGDTTQTVDGEVFEVVFDDLAAGDYDVSAVATNTAGDSEPATTTVTVGVTPSAPRDLTATQTGPRQFTLTFDAPADSGSSAITGYGIGVSGPNSSGGNEYPADTRRVVFDDVDPGTYDIQVRAINDSGPGERATTQITTSAQGPAASPSPSAAGGASPAPSSGASPRGTTGTRSAAGQLPRTGTTATIALSGLAVLLAGVALTVGARRRQSA